MHYHTNYTTALMQIIARAAAFNAIYTAQEMFDSDHCNHVARIVFDAQQEQSTYSSDIIELIARNGSTHVISVKAIEIHIGDIYVWTDEYGDIERAYPVQRFIAEA